MQNKKQYIYQKIFRFFLNLLTQEPSNREGLIEILRNAENRNLLDADALLMIEGALHVSETHVRDIMVPRVQMIIIDDNAKPEDILKTVVESGHSRFPVIGDTNDEIVGVNVTVPFKKLIIPFLDELDSTAEKTESVNTLFKVKNKVVGYNTDQPGFSLTMQELLSSLILLLQLVWF